LAVKLGVSRLGIYSSVVREFFEELGCKVVMPKRISSEIVKHGVMLTADMLCYPAKVTLGEHIYSLDRGATDLVFFSTCGLCRFKHYWQIHELALKKLGYKFRMHVLTLSNFIPKLMEITGASFEEVVKAILGMPLKIQEIEDRVYNRNNGADLKIGIVGEFFTCVENDINFNIVDKLQNLGVSVHNSMTLSHFVEKAIKLDVFSHREEKAESWQLLSDEIGGHGRDSIYNAAWYGKLGFDGVIHLLPLSCMPESTCEPFIDHVIDKYGIALYRFPIDESLFEVGMRTRIETFVSMLRHKKKIERNKNEP